MKISVLLAARDAEPFLGPALASLPSREDVEYVLVDDGSTDGTRSTMEAWLRDRNGSLIVNDTPCGLAASLNRGIRRCRAPYVARMDADDVMLSGRLEAQAQRLDADPGLVAIGGAGVRFGLSRERVTWRPLSDETIRVRLGLVNPFVHPAMMVRRRAISAERYDESFETSQDYDLWTRLARHGRLANLDRPVVKLRSHEGQTSQTKKLLQARNSAVISQEWLRSSGASAGSHQEHQALQELIMRARRLTHEEQREAIATFVATLAAGLAHAPPHVAANETLWAARFIARVVPDPRLVWSFSKSLAKLHPEGRKGWVRDLRQHLSSEGRRRVAIGPS